MRRNEIIVRATEKRVFILPTDLLLYVCEGLCGFMHAHLSISWCEHYICGGMGVKNRGIVAGKV